MRDRNRSSFQQESTKLPVSASNQLFRRVSFIRHARMQCYTMQNRSIQFNSSQPLNFSILRLKSSFLKKSRKLVQIEFPFPRAMKWRKFLHFYSTSKYFVLFGSEYFEYFALWWTSRCLEWVFIKCASFIHYLIYCLPIWPRRAITRLRLDDVNVQLASVSSS